MNDFRLDSRRRLRIGNPSSAWSRPVGSGRHEVDRAMVSTLGYPAVEKNKMKRLIAIGVVLALAGWFPVSLWAKERTVQYHIPLCNS